MKLALPADLAVDAEVDAEEPLVGAVDLVVKAGEAVTLPGRSVLVFRKTA